MKNLLISLVLASATFLGAGSAQAACPQYDHEAHTCCLASNWFLQQESDASAKEDSSFCCIAPEWKLESSARTAKRAGTSKVESTPCCLAAEWTLDESSTDTTNLTRRVDVPSKTCCLADEWKI